MSLLDALRAGVSAVNSVTKPMQATVRYRHYISEDWQGVKTYNPAVTLPGLPLKALVDWKQKQVRTQAGTLSTSRAFVMFVDITALMIATGGDGLDDSDIIVLPDGTTGPILDMSGFIDAGTGKPFATEVYLG